MVAIETITPALFPEIYRSFLAEDDPDLREEDWRRLFEYPWQEERDVAGYAMVDGDRVVGVLGMMFSTRVVDGTPERFCNLHTWHVAPSHRGRSLMLMRPVMQLADCTITDMTPTEGVYALSKRLGMQDLDSTLKVLLPWRPSRKQRSDGDWEMVGGDDLSEDMLADADRRVFRDHRDSPCRHMLLRAGDESCYLVFTRVKRHWMPYCHIHYVSNRELFCTSQRIIRHELLTRHRARFAAIDARLLAGRRLPRSFDVPLRSRQLYRSTTLKPHQIDTLYCEVSLLNLTTFPDLSGKLRGLARRRRRAS